MKYLFLLLAIFPLIAFAQTKDPDFRKTVEKRLVKDKLSLTSVCPVDSNVLAKRVFKDYGAMFVADTAVKYPFKCVFADESEVTAFQASVESSSVTIKGISVSLQTAAMNALLAARSEAEKGGLSISPRGATASKRSFASTEKLWASRFEPALKYWVGKKRIKPEDAAAARKLGLEEQAIKVIEWETESIWFSTRFNYSIFSSVAAAGTSQHLSMIAFDVAEFSNARVRNILNKHGWFQTIIDDTPHFTYLGLKEADLPSRGLIARKKDGFTFWIPNFDR